MCGRFVSSTPAGEIADFFDAEPPSSEISENYNVSPTSDIYVVGEGPTGRRMRIMHWGLVPAWAADTSGASRLINARSETVAEKPSFRSAFKRRRCIIPVDGFYEWTTVPGATRKQPMYIHHVGSQLLAFAGIYEFWRPKDATEDEPGLFSACILTCAANDTISAIHDRMPVILASPDWSLWMDPQSDPAALAAVMVPAAEDLLEMHPVSTEVNSSRNHGQHLTTRVEPSSIGEIPGQGSLL
jgi:putative SOS response-associated peptidase YedK